MGDDPAYLPVGTAVSAKYKGAFCEAKVSKVVRVVKCKITYKQGLGTSTVTDEHIRGPLRVGHTVQARHTEKKEFVEATITKIQDCSQYTVVFDDGDITTLRRTALCLKSGRHFNESETLDQLPLTHPEHWGFPVGGGRGRGRRSRQGLGDDGTDDLLLGSSTDGPSSPTPDRDQPDLLVELYSSDIGKVVCVEAGEKKKSSRDNWFPGLVVVPSAQPTVRINVRDEFLVRSFRDGRYYTVPRKEILEFSRDMGRGVENAGLADAMERALRYLDRDELPAHWERGPLFDLQLADSDSDAAGSDSSDDEPREEKDHFVAQLYKFMDDRGTPLNKNPTISNKDIDLYRLFRVVHKLGGYNRVTNQNKWRSVAIRLGYAHNHLTYNSVKQAYKKFLLNFDQDYYRKLGCTMINHPRNAKKNRGRSLIRDRDRATPSSPRPSSGGGANRNRSDGEPSSDTPTASVTTTTPVSDGKPALPDLPDTTSNSSSDADLTGATTPRAKKQKITKTRPTGDKVKALVDKFEEHAARAAKDKEDEAEREKPPPPTQQTRSKITGPRVTSGRATPAPKAPPQQPPPPPPTPTPAVVPQDLEDVRTKRGRKRKDTVTAETAPEATSSTTTAATTSTNLEEKEKRDQPVTAAVGDKLKVYYGPTHESKVTYEAKVLEVERDQSGGVMYLVHYTGWNTRYDEWIKPQRIAENLSAQNKAAKRLKQAAAANSPSPTGGKQTGKRGRAVPPVRSPARRAAASKTEPTTSRRTRRTSAVSTATTSDTDEEPADDARSDSEPEVATRTRSSAGRPLAEDTDRLATRRRPIPRTRPKGDVDEDGDDDEKPLRRAKRMVRRPPQVVAQADSDEDSPPPKGRDFDLNQIRSELKGFEKAVKITPTTEGTPDSAVPPEDTPGEKATTDDIYEFKEPEPFEFETGSSRKISTTTSPDQDKPKKRPQRPLYEDSPPPEKPSSPDKTPPAKKKGGRSPKDLDTGSSSPSPAKRRATATYRRNTPSKKPPPQPQTSTDEEEKSTGDKTPKRRGDDDPFDKLVESPSFNVGADKPSVSKVVKSLNLDVEALSLFRELPEEEPTPAEDSESDLGPEPPLFTHKEQIATTLDPIFRGFTTKQTTETPAETPGSDEDDPIGAAIQRAMTHTLTDEDSSSDDLFMRPEQTPERPLELRITPGPQVATEKQISPALQETDSRLLEAISQQTAQLLKKEEDLDLVPKEEPIATIPILTPVVKIEPKVGGTKIADSILQKFNLIKKKEETQTTPQIKEEPPLLKIEEKTPEQERTPTPTPVIKQEPEVLKAESPVEVESPRKRPMRKVATSREFIDSDTDSSCSGNPPQADEDSDSDSEPSRLVIAPPAEDDVDEEEETDEEEEPVKVESPEEPKPSPEEQKPEEEVAPAISPVPQDLVQLEDTTMVENKDDEQASEDISLLLCKETIPGSPAPETAPPGDTSRVASSAGKQPGGDISGVVDSVTRTKPRSAKSLLLEMPFASAPSVAQESSSSKQQVQQPLAVPLEESEATPGSASPVGSPPPLAPGENIHHTITENTLVIEPKKPTTQPSREHEAPTSSAGLVARKRRRSHRAGDEPNTSPATGTQAPPAKRGRRPLTSAQRAQRAQSADTAPSEDEAPPHQTPPHPTTRHSPRPSHTHSNTHPRYNFLVELDPGMDAVSRIALLQQRLSDLRKTYNDVKGELACIDRRRKKLRRRERDQIKQHKQEMQAVA